MRPAIREEIRVGLHFREFDPRVGLECVPKVAAAIAHKLRFGLVFFVARNKFAPIVLHPQFLHEEIVGVRPGVRQLRPLCNPIPQGGEHHVAEPFIQHLLVYLEKKRDSSTPRIPFSLFLFFVGVVIHFNQAVALLLFGRGAGTAF